MAEAPNQQEPSMEEILASIRRIIAEDNEPETPPPEPAPLPILRAEPMTPPTPSVASMLNHQEEDDDVLELTDIVQDESPPMVDEVELSRYDPEPPPFNPFSSDEDRLVSNATAAASSAAFSAVGGLLRGRGDIPVGNGALTLESLVRELVRPMLKEWLDENLPSLVERLVRDEVQRLARGGV